MKAESRFWNPVHSASRCPPLRGSGDTRYPADGREKSATWSSPETLCSREKHRYGLMDYLVIPGILHRRSGRISALSKGTTCATTEEVLARSSMSRVIWKTRRIRCSCPTAPAISFPMRWKRMHLPALRSSAPEESVWDMRRNGCAKPRFLDEEPGRFSAHGR